MSPASGGHQLTARELTEAQRRLKRALRTPRRDYRRSTQIARAQATIDRAEAEARAVGALDVLVLLPSGYVVRVSHRDHGLLPALLRTGPADRGVRGLARRDGDLLRFASPFGWTRTGMIVDRP